jgi:phosphodiesterase/alkaline phosphatase D-like protein
MNKSLLITLAFALASAGAFAQSQEEKKETPAEQRAEDRAGHELHKNSPPDRITGGPVIESVSDHSAVIAWSTNEPSSSVLTYGTDRNSLNQKAEAPWGGKPHRVYLRNLQPNTSYFFRVHSGEAKGSGTSVDSPVYEFKTVPKGSPPNRQNVNVGVKPGR